MSSFIVVQLVLNSAEAVLYRAGRWLFKSKSEFGDNDNAICGAGRMQC